MRTITRSLLLLALGAALACAGKAPPPDFAYDRTASFSGLTTYAWFQDPAWEMPGGNSIVDGQFIDRHVRQDVDAALQKKGYRKIEGGAPSFFVAYTTNPAGVASQDKWGVYGWWSWAYVGYYGSKYQKAGTLVLDVRDSSSKLMWRGARTALVGSNPDALARDIQRAVDILISEFPPAPGKEAK